MLKFKILVSILVLLVGFSVAQARSFSDIDFILTGKIEDYCPSGRQALGCFNPNNQSIALRDDLRPLVFRSVLTHEIGHWLTQDLEVEDYAIFGTGTLHQLQERTAIRFVEFVWYPFLMSNKIKLFFFNLIKLISVI